VTILICFHIALIENIIYNINTIYGYIVVICEVSFMKISISESAKKQFMEDNNKNYRIFIKGYG